MTRMSNFSQDFTLLSKAMDLRTQRHQVLASNIANADTPNYKARDFDFQSAMEKAMAGQVAAGGLTMAATSGKHLQGNSSGSAVNLQFRRETQSAVDGNTVDMDVERGQIADNAMQYQILTQLVSDRFRGWKSALASAQG